MYRDVIITEEELQAERLRQLCEQHKKNKE